MRRRSGVWLAVGAVVVFGGFTLGLLVNRAPDKLTPYSVARAALEAKFPSTPTSAFFVTDLSDPRTSVVQDGPNIRVSGMMRTNNSQLAANTRSAPNGEIGFVMTLNVQWKPFLQRVYKVRSIHFDTPLSSAEAKADRP